MTIELIPVIEIGYDKQDSTLFPYLSGLKLFKLPEISDESLAKITISHTQEMRDGIYERAEACSFWGGYVLKIDGKDKYFPQCCGELSDIQYWAKISIGQHSYHEEHPSPQIKFENDIIEFDFSVDESDEQFEPKPEEIKLSIDKYELQKAVEKAKEELLDFEKRLIKINETENLNIEDIGGLLIWENGNYE
jgi:hypothetical protein